MEAVLTHILWILISLRSCSSTSLCRLASSALDLTVIPSRNSQRIRVMVTNSRQSLKFADPGLIFHLAPGPRGRKVSKGYDYDVSSVACQSFDVNQITVAVTKSVIVVNLTLKTLAQMTKSC